MNTIYAQALGSVLECFEELRRFPDAHALLVDEYAIYLAAYVSRPEQGVVRPRASFLATLKILGDRQPPGTLPFNDFCRALVPAIRQEDAAAVMAAVTTYQGSA